LYLTSITDFSFRHHSWTMWVMVDVSASWASGQCWLGEVSSTDHHLPGNEPIRGGSCL